MQFVLRLCSQRDEGKGERVPFPSRCILPQCWCSFLLRVPAECRILHVLPWTKNRPCRVKREKDQSLCPSTWERKITCTISARRRSASRKWMQGCERGNWKRKEMDSFRLIAFNKHDIRELESSGILSLSRSMKRRIELSIFTLSTEIQEQWYAITVDIAGSMERTRSKRTSFSAECWNHAAYSLRKRTTSLSIGIYQNTHWQSLTFPHIRIISFNCSSSIRSITYIHSEAALSSFRVTPFPPASPSPDRILLTSTKRGFIPLLRFFFGKSGVLASTWIDG